MGRKSSRELVGEIAETLGENPQSIKEISEKVDADRKSVTGYLEELKKAGMVKETEEGRSRKFYVSKYEDRKTYFGLPLDDQQELRLKTIFSAIKEGYEQRYDEVLSKAKAQKIAVRTLDRCSVDLDLPYGGYKYGSITMMSFTPSEEYPFQPDSIPRWGEVEDCIEEAIEFYSDGDFDAVKQKQYSEEDMELYLAKEDILEMLTCEASSSSLERRLYDFVAYTPALDETAHDIMMDFVAIAPELVQKDKGRAKAVQVFEAIWSMIAVYRLYEDLEEDFYREDILENKLGPEKKEKRNEAMEALSEVIGIETVEEPSDEFEEL